MPSRALAGHSAGDAAGWAGREVTVKEVSTFCAVAVAAAVQHSIPIPTLAPLSPRFQLTYAFKEQK